LQSISSGLYEKGKKTMSRSEELKKKFDEKQKELKTLFDQKDACKKSIEAKCDKDIEDYKNANPRPTYKLGEDQFKIIYKKYSDARRNIKFKYTRSLVKIFFICLLVAFATYIVFYCVNNALDYPIFEDSPEGRIIQLIASVIIPIIIFITSCIKRSRARSTIKKCEKNETFAAYLKEVDEWADKINEIKNNASKALNKYDDSINALKKELEDLEDEIVAAKMEEDEDDEDDEDDEYDDDEYDDDDCDNNPLIVILGDDPGLSTGAVGYITFDNKEETLVSYSDYPQAYSVPGGKHSVLITADPKDSPIYDITARLDKVIDFGYNNVLWVDIRSTYSNTQIDWKVLPRSEYNKIPADARASIIQNGSID